MFKPISADTSSVFTNETQDQYWSRYSVPHLIVNDIQRDPKNNKKGRDRMRVQMYAMNDVVVVDC